MPRPRAGRAQIAFLIVLLVAVTQVLWWIYDQAGYSRERQQELLGAYEAERATAEALFTADPNGFERVAAQLAERFPHLEVDGGTVRIRAESIAQLERERRSHVNQYRWEGAFFLLVLLAGIWVIRRALLQERELRLRQENFLAAVSHELKTPIASLRLAGDTMRRHDLDDERRSKLLQRNRRDLDRLEDLVTKLLDTSRIEARKLQLHPVDVTLVPLVRRLAEELEAEVTVSVPQRLERDNALPPTGICLGIDVPVDFVVRADPVGLETVLRNLLSNALAAVRDSERPEISVTARHDGTQNRRTTIEVRDNGVGFVPTEAERIFGKFYRPGSEMQRSTQGTGLGLYLVKRFVELEGGEVSASSPGPKQGATFRVSLPG